MLVDAVITIDGSRAAVWAAITDIENAAAIVGGIEKIEILEQPARGLVGLRWRETRILFGKPASVDKWITEAVEQAFYRTRAEDGGFVFVTTQHVAEEQGHVTLSSAHESLPQGFVAKLQMVPMKLLFKGVIRKAILQDLNDIKAAVEKR